MSREIAASAPSLLPAREAHRELIEVAAAEPLHAVEVDRDDERLRLELVEFPRADTDVLGGVLPAEQGGRVCGSLHDAPRAWGV